MKGVDTAVILAAGLGSRLGDLKEDRPKAFLKFGGITLIDRSIGLLKEKGISSIIIGTGYRNEFFDALKEKYPEVSTCRNVDFNKTGSMHTLFVLRDFIKKTFLLLEGDLLYESAALDYVLTDYREDIILASDATHSGDEVYIQTTKEGCLKGMSKNLNDLDDKIGELVGISKLSTNTLSSMVSFAEKKSKIGELDIHYENALVGISKEKPIYVKLVKDLAWCEIDDENHLQRARTLIFPRIIERT